MFNLQPENIHRLLGTKPILEIQQNRKPLLISPGSKNWTLDSISKMWAVVDLFSMHTHKTGWKLFFLQIYIRKIQL